MEKQGGYKVVLEKKNAVITKDKLYVFILDKDYTEFLKILKK